MIVFTSLWRWLNANSGALGILLACLIFYYQSHEKIHADLRELNQGWKNTKPVRWAIAYWVAMAILLPLSGYALLVTLPWSLWLTIPVKVLSFWLIASAYKLFVILRETSKSLPPSDQP